MRFKIGDRFTYNGDGGTIADIVYDLNSSNNKYSIKMDYGSTNCVDVKYGDENFISIPTDNLRSGYYYGYKTQCDHFWINVGFSYPKMVCKHCDKDKE